MDETAFRAILRRLGMEPAGTADRPLVDPLSDPELARRVEAFRRQLATWTGPGVPLLVLPGVPEPRRGRCVSCGEPAPEGWRCALCLRAVFIALGMPPTTDPGEVTAP